MASDLGLASIVIPQAAPRINSLYQQQAHLEYQASVSGLWTQARQSEPPNQLAHVFRVSAVDAANLVRDSYWTLLSEQPDPVASQFWQLQVQDGLPASQLKVAFLSSDEYLRQQGGDLGSWVSAVYRDALGRIPDQSDVTYWQDQVNSGLTLTGAAAAIVTSTEAEQLADQADQLRQLWHGDTQSSASPATHSLLVQISAGMESAVTRLQPALTATNSTLAPTEVPGLFTITGEPQILTGLMDTFSSVAYVRYADSATSCL